MQGHAREKIILSFLGQAVAGTFVVVVFIFISLPLALAALFGAALMFLANSLFAIRFFRHFSYAPNHVMNRFYTGALIKWLILIVGFIIAVKLGLLLLGLVMGIVAVLIGFYVASFIHATITQQ